MREREGKGNREREGDIDRDRGKDRLRNGTFCEEIEH